MTKSDWDWLNRVVNRFAKRLPPQVDRRELVSDAYLALASLKERYDPEMGVPFRGFAYRRVVGAIQDGLRARYRPSEERVGDNDVVVEHPPRLPMDLPLHNLPRISRLVIQLHYFEEVELRTIAATFACSQARISQIHQAALRTLRTTCETQCELHQARFVRRRAKAAAGRTSALSSPGSGAIANSKPKMFLFPE